ncbi:MAG: flagellar motor switch phosphatase FliY [Desulfitobacteriaceae bacterium]
MGNGMLSQEEIDALLRGTLEPEVSNEEPPIVLTDMEKDAIGEIANISMGTAATTLSQLLGKKVDITTPKVDVCGVQQIYEDYPIPSVIVNVKYKAGLEGSNLLILSQRDGAVIVDLMMGGDGENPSEELSELQISGVSEAMNQMMGSAATSMSTMFKSIVDICPPQLVLNDLSKEGESDFLNKTETYVRISFRMVVEKVIDSVLVQVISLDVAKGMVTKLLGGVKTAVPENVAPSASAAILPPVMQTDSPTYPPPTLGVPPYGAPPYGTNVPPSQQDGYYNPPPNYAPGPTTQIQPAQFSPLQNVQHMPQPDNLGLILDVSLQVSVELGKARKTIKEILEMGPGSVIELDRLAGEPVDMIINGKLIAKCEVVVINETFGIRITDIVHPIERMKTLN